MKSLNVDESTAIVGPNTSERETKTLLNLFDRADDLIEIRPVAGVEFGMEEFAIGANFEGATARRDERERLDTLAEFKNLGRQTDGLGRVVSNHAIFDRYFGFHVELLSDSRLGLANGAVNGFGRYISYGSQERVKIARFWLRNAMVDLAIDP